jgi:hypothetical protein
MEKTYVVAPKSAEPNSGQWLEKIRNVPGVRFLSGTPDQALVAADQEGIARLKALLGPDFMIEEQLGRTLGS